MTTINPFLWFDRQAEEAANFYCSVFKDSKITAVTRAAADNPSNKKGEVMTVAFKLNGEPFVALNGGPQFKFNESISFVINCGNLARRRLLLEQAHRGRSAGTVRLAEGQVRALLAGGAHRAGRGARRQRPRAGEAGGGGDAQDVEARPRRDEACREWLKSRAKVCARPFVARRSP